MPRRPFALSALFCAMLVLAACAGPGRYPVSGEPCGPDDPVKDLSPAHCTPAG